MSNIITNSEDIQLGSKSGRAYQRLKDEETKLRLPTSKRYHDVELNTYGMFMKHILAFMWIGIGLFVTSVVMVLFGKLNGSIVSFISAALVELFSGIIQKTMSKLMQSKYQQFDILANQEHDMLFLEQVDAIENSVAKVELLKQYLKKDSKH